MIKGLSQSLEASFFDALPHLACVSDDFSELGIVRETKKKAITYKNIQVNKNSMIQTLCFDVDSSNGAFQWEDNNCLPPNWVTVNPANGHSHYGYMINKPVSKTFRSKPQPQLFISAVNKGMALKLGSDRAYSGFMTKNPMHEHWRTFTAEERIYDLNELADNFPLVWGSKDKSLDECGELGRHQSLFERHRFDVYRVTQRYRNNRDEAGLIAHARIIFSSANMEFDEPLPAKQVESLAKCVARWSYVHYKGDGKDRGACELDLKGHNLSKRDKQVIGVAHTNKVRKLNTERKIKEAISLLIKNGKKVNVSSVAAVSKLSRPTIYSYKHLLKV